MAQGEVLHRHQHHAARLGDELGTQITGARAAQGTFGDEWRTQDSSTFDDDYEKVEKTMRMGGQLDLGFLRNIADPGQVALKAANDDRDGAAYNFRIELDDDAPGVSVAPTTFKFPAKVLSFASQGPANPGTLLEYRSRLEIESGITEIAAA